MATATLKLYTGSDTNRWKLNANKFFVVDDLEQYLATYSTTTTTITNFQYIKCELEIAIVVDLTQVNSLPLHQNGIKYVSIVNSNENKTYYYYVKKPEWRGKQSVKLYLVMDVANTFKSGTDFAFTEKTKITREHKNRLLKKSVNYDLLAEDIETYGGIDQEGGFINNSYFESAEAFDEEEIDAYNEFGSTNTIYSIYDDNLGRNLTEEEYWDAEVVITGFSEAGAMIGTIYARIPDDYATHTFYVSVEVHIEGDKYTRKVDLLSEGLTPILYKKSEEVIRRDNLIDCDWFLLYRNQNDPTEALVNPVECYLIPSKEIPVNVGSIQTGGRVNPDNLELGKYYYIPLTYHQTRTITLSTGTSISYSSPNNPFVIMQKTANNKIMALFIKWVAIAGVDTSEVYQTEVCDYFNIDSLPTKYLTSNTYSSIIYSTFTAWSLPYEWDSSGYSPLTLDDIDKVDRTDAKNIKLIKLPYLPYDFEISGGKLVITDTDFEHVSLTQSGGGIIEVLKLTNLNVKFNYNFQIGSSPLSVLSVGEHTFDVNDLRDDTLESKIYHSDFYQPKFVYDSFAYVFQLERMDINTFIASNHKENMELKYVVSTTINSRFMFQFTDYVSYVAREDYNNVMPIARNNEIVLYNVPYINYIRTGYNYDVKNKSTQASTTWSSVGFGVLGTTTALMFPSTPLKVAGVVASILSTITAIRNGVVSQVQAERSLDEKMLASKNQSTAISGSDDVDLMSVYTENRAKMCLYEVSDNIKNLLLDLFYYTGYVSNRMGLPNTKTRISFDYLEADIVITDYSNMSTEIMDELVGVYKNGLTFIHHVASRTSDKWDMDQIYENYEVNFN